jgi:hypothetical protein
VLSVCRFQSPLRDLDEFNVIILITTQGNGRTCQVLNLDDFRSISPTGAKKARRFQENKRSIRPMHRMMTKCVLFGMHWSIRWPVIQGLKPLRGLVKPANRQIGNRKEANIYQSRSRINNSNRMNQKLKSNE